MGYLNTLPLEITRLIVDQCDFEDSKNLRVTCKNVARVANYRVFRTCRIAFFQSHLERLVELSKDPTIAPCIKHLVIVGDVLPNIETVEAFEKLVDTRDFKSWKDHFYDKENVVPEHVSSQPLPSALRDYQMQLMLLESQNKARFKFQSMPRHEFSNEELMPYFERYQAYRRQQLEWNSDGDFKQALTRLPRLQSVTNTKCSFSNNRSQFPWNRLKQEILLTPDDWLQNYAVEADDEVLRDDPLEDLVHMRHVHDLLDAVAQRAESPDAVPLRTLKLVNIGGQPLIDRDAALEFKSESQNEFDLGNIDHEKIYLWNMVQGLTHLTTLDLDLSYKIPSNAPTSAEQSPRTRQLFEEVHAILLQPKALQVLRLKCDDEESDWTEAERPMDADDDALLRLQVPTFSRLHTLHLTCTLTEGSLLTLLQNHAATVTNLQLIDCDMNAGTWKSILRKVPHVLRLKEVYLEGLHDEEYPPNMGDEALFESGLGTGVDQAEKHHERAIRRYLLHGGEMPELDFGPWCDGLADRVGDMEAYLTQLDAEEEEEDC